MIIFYLIALLGFFPVIGFLLAKESKNKAFVFSCSFIVLGLSLFGFISKFSILGSIQEQMLSDQLKDAVDQNIELQDHYFDHFTATIADKNKILWLEEVILFAVDNNSLITAEQLVEFAEPIFTKSDLQIRFYALYSILRDKKFPDFAFSSINTDFVLPKNCNFVSIQLNAFINEGPAVPIAQIQSEDSKIMSISITNQDALIPGFDLASALINDEDIVLNSQLNCQNNLTFSSSLFPKKLSKNKALFGVKISEKDWFVNSQ